MGCTGTAACPRRTRAQSGCSTARLYGHRRPSRALVVMVVLLMYAAHSAAAHIHSEETDMSTPATPAECTETSECTLADVLSAIDDIEEMIERNIDSVVDGIDTLWILFSAAMVVFMQAGFAMLEAGAIRSKNIRSILLKNLFDFAVGTLAFWCCGYALAYGESWNHFLGTTKFFLVDVSGKEYGRFIFQLPFAATATTIVSGSMAERTRLNSYLVEALLLTGFITPMVMHWCWNKDGVFSTRRTEPFLGTGFIDFAGSGVVHMVGGLAGVTGSYVLGQRHDENGVLRFDSTRARDFIGHNAIYSTLGMFVLWVGWYGFNAGSTQSIVGATETAGRVFVNTTLATAFSTITTFAWESRHGYALASCLNGILAGLVAVTGPCAVVDGWAACVVGVIGAGAYNFGSWLLLRLRIDDPLDASPLHFCCGLWGVVSVGLFAKLEYLESVYGITDEVHAGAFLGGDGTLLAVQLVTAACICAWTVGTCIASFCGIKYLPKLLRLTDQEDCLRVPLKQELAGLDVSYHAGWEFPPYLMPLVENLRALTQVQEKLAEQATHVGSYGDLISQMSVGDRDESHSNSVGHTANTLDTEMTFTANTLGSKMSSSGSKASSEHMLMLHEALAKVNTPSAVTDAYRLREEMQSMRGVRKGASKFWRSSKERRALEDPQGTVDDTVFKGKVNSFTTGTEDTWSNPGESRSTPGGSKSTPGGSMRRPAAGNIPHDGLDAGASVQSVKGKVHHWRTFWAEPQPPEVPSDSAVAADVAVEWSVERPARDGSEEPMARNHTS